MFDASYKDPGAHYEEVAYQPKRRPQMNDLVKRLHLASNDYTNSEHAICAEAANEIEILRERLKAVEKLPERWRRPHNITRNRPDAKDFCADELETALKENDDE